jgi:hypothetical protein
MPKTPRRCTLPHVCRLPTAWDAAAQRKIPIVGVGAPHLHVSGARVGATHLSKCDARRELDLKLLDATAKGIHEVLVRLPITPVPVNGIDHRIRNSLCTSSGAHE